VHVPLEGELQLGAHAVGAAHQHRLAVALGYLEQRAEAADARQHALAQRLLRQRLDALDQRVARVDVDAGILVREGGSVHAVRQPGATAPTDRIYGRF